MKKEPTYTRNARVEFKDNNGIFHVGYVKRGLYCRVGLFRKAWIYDICESGGALDIRKVYTVPERNIFGLVISKEHPKTLADRPQNKPNQQLNNHKQ